MTFKASITLTLSTLLLFGCGRSDYDAPPLQAESPYLCSTVNDLIVMNEQRQAENIIGMSLSIMSREYGDESSIERFYKLHLKGYTYKVMFNDLFFNICESNASLGVNEAATQSLSQLYLKVSDIAGLATCSALNDGTLSFDDVLTELSNPTVGKSNQYLGATRVVLKESEYGADYIEENLFLGCEEQPDYRVVDVAREPIVIAAKDILEKERKLREKKRDDEKKAREKAEIAKFRKNVDEYSESIFSTGEASCDRLRDQFYTFTDAKEESDKEDLRDGLKASLVEISKELLPYQKSVFDSIVEEELEEIAASVLRTCFHKQYDLRSSLMSVRDIYNAKGPIEEELIAINNSKRDSASTKALNQFQLCRINNFKDALCFSEADLFYSYFLIESEMKQLEISQERLNSKIRMESGRRKVNQEKLSQFESELKLLQEKIAPLNKKIVDLEKVAISTQPKFYKYN